LKAIAKKVTNKVNSVQYAMPEVARMPLEELVLQVSFCLPFKTQMKKK
jgi:hypothetical protein